MESAQGQRCAGLQQGVRIQLGELDSASKELSRELLAGIAPCHNGFSCYRAARSGSPMNVTVKLPDDLCREARHRAVARSQSLSQWIADVLRQEIARAHPERKTLLERLGDPATADLDFALPDRKRDEERSVDFP